MAPKITEIYVPVLQDFGWIRVKTFVGTTTLVAERGVLQSLAEDLLEHPGIDARL